MFVDKDTTDNSGKLLVIETFKSRVLVQLISSEYYQKSLFPLVTIGFQMVANQPV